MARRKTSNSRRERSVDRGRVLDVASQLLLEEGAGALSMRRIAQEVGVSTMPLYTLFENKEGLMLALVGEGFRRFAAALGSVRETDPWARLRSLGRAYRRFAAENPTYFALMWTPAGQPRPAEGSLAREDGEAAYRYLQNAVTDLMSTLDRPAKEIEPAAANTWSTVHGFCTLEMAGVFADPEQADLLYESTLDFVERAIRG